jgi:hypothetical protein
MFQNKNLKKINGRSKPLESCIPLPDYLAACLVQSSFSSCVAIANKRLSQSLEFTRAKLHITDTTTVA